MAWLEVTKDFFDWEVPGRGGRVVICYQRGVHEVTHTCLEDAIAAGAGKKSKRPPNAPPVGVELVADMDDPEFERIAVENRDG